jgi:hypothetical protein
MKRTAAAETGEEKAMRHILVWLFIRIYWRMLAGYPQLHVARVTGWRSFVMEDRAGRQIAGRMCLDWQVNWRGFWKEKQ